MIRQSPTIPAEISYWWVNGQPNTTRQYLVDWHNSYRQTGQVSGPMKTDSRYPDFEYAVKRNGNQVIDVTGPGDATLTVTSVESIGGSRNYLLRFHRWDFEYEYVVRDCNHPKHAFNRFAKRVREEINPKLGTNIRVVAADRTEPEKFPEHVSQLTRGQKQMVWNFANEFSHGFSVECSDPNCPTCQKTYREYVKYRKEQDAQLFENNTPAPTVAEVVEKVQALVQEASAPDCYSTYLIYPDKGENGAVWLGDYTDPFIAMQDASEIGSMFQRKSFAQFPVEVRSGNRVCARFNAGKAEFFGEVG